MDTVERIFYLLNERKMEQKEFAAKIGVSENVVSTWRTGRTKSYSRHLSKIAEVLNTTPEYLLTGQESAPAADPELGDDPFWDRMREVYVQLTPQKRVEAFENFIKEYSR